MPQLALPKCLAVLLLVSTIFTQPAAAQADAWVQQVEARIASVRTYPRSAQVRGESGTAVLNLKVDGNGLITGYEVARSSGSDILDREAERALDKIGQFDAPADRRPRTAAVRVTWPAPSGK